MQKKQKIKKISVKNKKKWIEYDKKYKDKTLNNFIKYIYYLNEMHINLTVVFNKYTLIKQNTQLQLKNLQKIFKKKENTIHLTAIINWYWKSSLYFYNCINNSSEIKLKEFYSSHFQFQSTQKIKKNFQQRVKEWKTEKSHYIRVKKTKNFIT